MVAEIAVITPPKMPMTMTLEVITPAKAREYLAMSGINRPLVAAIWGKYARDMKADSWHMTNAAIAFDDEGRLSDGQHRLKAIVESGVTVTMWVSRGMPKESQAAIDIGYKRSVADILSFRGERETTTLAATLRYARHFDRFSGAPSGMGNTAPTPDELLRYLDDNPGVRGSIHTGRAVNDAVRVSPSMAAALHYLEASRSPTHAQEFWDQVISGLRVEADTGPYALRQALLRNLAAKRGERLDQNTLAAIMIKAWNYWFYDRPIKQLRWFRGGVANEAFPRIGDKPKPSGS